MAGLLQVDSCTLVKLSGLQLSNRIREASLQTGATDCVRLLRARTSAHEDGTCRKLGGASCNVEVGAVTRRDEVTSTVGTGGTSYTSPVTWRGHRTQGLRQQRLMHRLPDLAQLLVSGVIDVLMVLQQRGESAHLMGFGVQLFKHVADEYVVLYAQQLRHPLRNPDLQHQVCAMLIWQVQVQIARMVRQNCSSLRRQTSRLAIRGQAATAPS